MDGTTPDYLVSFARRTSRQLSRYTVCSSGSDVYFRHYLVLTGKTIIITTTLFIH